MVWPLPTSTAPDWGSARKLSRIEFPTQDPSLSRLRTTITEGHDDLEREGNPMKCQEIMKKDIECISPRDTVEDAACKMRDENIGFLPVCDQSMKVQGTLTDRDIALRVVASGKDSDTLVEDVMTREVISCSALDDVQKAEKRMAQNRKSRIMCLDDGGRLVGVISLSDIAQHSPGTRAADTLREISHREATF